jgi:hypothetical protein
VVFDGDRDRGDGEPFAGLQPFDAEFNGSMTSSFAHTFGYPAGLQAIGQRTRVG